MSELKNGSEGRVSGLRLALDEGMNGEWCKKFPLRSFYKKNNKKYERKRHKGIFWSKKFFMHGGLSSSWK